MNAEDIPIDAYAGIVATFAARQDLAGLLVGYIEPDLLDILDGPAGYFMLWKKNDSSMEIRTQGELADGRPALDEILASGASIHLEQMSHDQWWMGIEAGGKCFHLNFGLRNGQLTVNLSDQDEEEYTDWEGDSRERPLPGNDG